MAVEVKGDYFGYEIFYDGPNITVTLKERDRIMSIIDENDELRSRNYELEQAIDEVVESAKTLVKALENR